MEPDTRISTNAKFAATVFVHTESYTGIYTNLKFTVSCICTYGIMQILVFQ